MTDPEKVKEVVGTVFGSLPPMKKTVIVLSEVWLNDNEKWEVSADSGYFITEMRPDPALTQEFATKDEAKRYAHHISYEWRVYGEHTWRKGAKA